MSDRATITFVVGHWLRRLAEHVRIDQVSHESLGAFTWSVVSDFELLARLDAIALADFRGEK